MVRLVRLNDLKKARSDVKELQDERPLVQPQLLGSSR